ncbi:MAG: hypothetical protein OER88_04045 [Planctomycetota bacterium]|nr:hypothetical protein [Planctomycetota bacterium]
MKRAVGVALILAGCGPTIHDVAWETPADAFHKSQWVFLYRDFPD